MPAMLSRSEPRARSVPLAGLAALVAVTAYAIAFLWIESELAILVLVLGGAAIVLGAGRARLARSRSGPTSHAIRPC